MRRSRSSSTSSHTATSQRSWGPDQDWPSGPAQDGAQSPIPAPPRHWLKNGTWQYLALTVCFTGLQFSWSVEMAYGTPYLLSLGLPKSLMSLVWLAGPLSGLIMQPLVGAWSDRNASKYGRRRPFLIAACAIVVLCFIALAWARDIAGLVIHHDRALKLATIGLAVGAIYLLDFAINVIQACGRALIVDVLPPSQQELGTAWASRMTGVGNVLGYLTGYIDLVHALPFLGHTQLKVLCLIASMVLAGSVAATCYFIHEEPIEASSTANHSPWQTMRIIFASARNLPAFIQRVCNIQVFSWAGWFPFLFYSTTYIASIYTYEHLVQSSAHSLPNLESTNTTTADSTMSDLHTRLASQLITPNQRADNTGSSTADANADLVGVATRAGSFAMLIYAITSLIASWLLPLVVTPSSEVGQPGPEPMVSSPSTTWIRRTLMGLKQGVHMVCCGKLTLPRLWFWSQCIFSMAMLSTFVVASTTAATIMVAVCGLCWSVTMWAPFSLIGEYLSQHERGVDMAPTDYSQVPQDTTELQAFPGSAEVGSHAMTDGRASSFTNHSLHTPSAAHHVQVGALDTDRQPLSPKSLRPSRESLRPLDHHHPLPHALPEGLPESNELALSSGIILGIHNMYVVFPQFVISFVSSVIFALFDSIHPAAHQPVSSSPAPVHPTEGDPDNAEAIAWVLRVGGLSSVVAAYLATRLFTSRR
ncbi:hypothetical protein H4R34_002028 [Dimargaris verticillata]|uniref:Major facilitator superfamily domain-containing protein n=1 Tax=Dimargaris verticillata TaxID=2761393 RepID=A0A9W8B7B3_9FUNG|nr:hypothetical protein H4R34_002028 [Dimargaris verticillata]